MNCLACKLNKGTTKKYGHTKGHLFYDEKFKAIASDIIGPFEKRLFSLNSDYRHFFEITIIDICSRFVQINFSKKVTAVDIIKNLEIWITNHGKPQKFVSDQGRQYNYTKLQKWLSSRQIKHYPTSIYNPRENGVVENINKQISNLLLIYKGHSLEEVKGRIELSLNTTCIIA